MGQYISFNPAAQFSPAVIPNDLINVTAIAGGLGHSVALKKDGTVVAWGNNNLGQTNVPFNLSGVIAIATKNDSNLALRRDGTVAFWGSNSEGNLDVPADLSNAISIALGSNHALALKKDGSLVSWGSNFNGQTSPPVDLNGLTAIAAGSIHNLALRADGSLVAWGGLGVTALNGAQEVPANLTGIKLKAIAAGEAHSLALKQDGTVFAWGNNGFGQCDVPDGLKEVVAIAAGNVHSMALKSDGTVVVWGDNSYGARAVPAGMSGANFIGAGAAQSLAANAVPLIQPYTLSGFLSPVDNPPAANLAKSGRTYPLKWQLKDSSGAWVSAVSAITSLSYQPVQCGQFTGSLNAITEIPRDTSGASALRYDDTANQFIFNWKTPAIGCYVVSIGVDTGQSFSANFNITR